MKIEAFDNPPAASTPPDSPTPSPTAATVSPTASAQQFVTLTKKVRIEIPYGETMIPAGTKLSVLKRDGSTVTVQYLNHTQIIPISSTDLK
jgi:hypothetical protein